MAKRSSPALEIWCPRRTSHLAAMRCGAYQVSDGCGEGCRFKADPDTIHALYVIRGDIAAPNSEVIDDAD